MQTIEAIHTRRSIRNYLLKKIDRKISQEILSCAMDAPSAMNAQPWEFIIIDSPNILSAIPNICPHAQMAKQAPMAILVCGNIKKSYEDFWIQDCSAATQNILLASHDKSLGAVWTGVYPKKDRIENLQKLLNIPKDIIPFSLIILGYPKETPRQKENFSKEKIHLNTWESPL